MKKIVQFILVALFAAGCSTTPPGAITLHVAEPHTAVPVQSVVFMPTPPTEGVLIAQLSTFSANSPAEVEAAQADLKKSAAAIGATVLVLNDLNLELYGLDEKYLRISGRAYFVPSSEK